MGTRIPNFGELVTPRRVAKALFEILDGQAEKGEIPKEEIIDLETFKKSIFMVKDCKNRDSILCKAVSIAIGGKVSDVTVTKYALKIYKWFFNVKFEEMKKYYKDFSAKKGNDYKMNLDELDNPPDQNQNLVNYEQYFNPKAIASAIFDVLHEDPYERENLYADFDKFLESDVWRRHASRSDDFWPRVVLNILHRKRVKDKTMRKYTKRMYNLLLLSESEPFLEVKKFFSEPKETDVEKLVKNIEELSINIPAPLENVILENDGRCLIELFREHQYPVGFPYVTRVVMGNYVTVNSFRSLAMNEKLDHNIINMYLLSLSEIIRGNNKKIVPFESFLVSGLLDIGYIAKGYTCWLAQTDLWGACAWLLPLSSKVGRAYHWSLYIVVPRDKIIIYIDSLHKNSTKKRNQNLCAFIQAYSNEKIKWEDWLVFNAKDVPKQNLGDQESLNSGVHLCTWAYILCAEKYEEFEETQMGNIRKSIACQLIVTDLKEKKPRKETITPMQVIREKVGFRVQLEPLAEVKCLQSLKKMPMNYENTLKYLSSLLTERLDS